MGQRGPLTEVLAKTTTMAHHHRHQGSLENILDFSDPPGVSVSQRELAARNFYRIIKCFDSEERSQTESALYNRPQLVQSTYEYALSEESRDLLLQAFFRFIGLSPDNDEGVTDGNWEEIRYNVVGFADFLMDNLFLPRIVFPVKKKSCTPFLTIFILQSGLQYTRPFGRLRPFIRKTLWYREEIKSIQLRQPVLLRSVEPPLFVIIIGAWYHALST